MDTVTLTIDGSRSRSRRARPSSRPPSSTAFSVPYYCYHPGISIDGSCRVCLVKIEKMAKLQTACSTRRTDGMVVVDRRRPTWSQARAGVFEFLLVNHPLDCPVCDKGGECPLQDFSYSFGPQRKPDGVPAPHVRRRGREGRRRLRADADAEPQPLHPLHAVRPLHARDRRRRADRHRRARQRQPDRDVQRAGRPLAALGQPDGRLPGRRDHHARLPLQVAARGTTPTRSDTICTLCSKGCSTTAWIKAKPEWAKGARLVRFTPRYEPAVNGYWMCDIGRFGYHWIEGEERLSSPLVREGAGHQQSTTWEAALKALGERAAVGRARRLHVPDVGARVERGDLPHRAAGERDRGELEVEREASSRRHEVPRPGRSTRPT